MVAVFTDPLTVGIDHSAVGFGGRYISAVGIQQANGICNHFGENRACFVSSACRLILRFSVIDGHIHLAVAVVGIGNDLTALYAADVGTAFGGVGITGRGVQCACNLDLGILQIRLGTGVGTAGGVGYRNQILTGGTGIGTPLVCIHHIDLHAICQNALRAAFHGHLCAGQHDDLLIHGQLTAGLGGQADVVGDGQIIICCIQIGCTDLQAHRLHVHLAALVHGDVQPVGGAVVPLGDRAGSQVKHGIGLGHKCYRSGYARFGHYDAGVAVLGGTGINGQVCLDVLDVVLMHGEYFVGLHLAGCGFCTAAEVHDLEKLVHITAVVGVNIALAGDEAPGIQPGAAVYIDHRAVIHVDHTDRAGGAAAGDVLLGAACVHFGREAEATFHVDGSTVCHRQLPVYGRCYVCRFTLKKS